jgi:hypothetical protein
MAATEGNSHVKLRIGGWLPAPDADRGDPDGSAVTELIPRVRGGGPMTEPPPPARPPAASTHAIRLGVVAPAITDADESRHRRHRRRPVALVAAATVALAGGVPLVLGLISGPTLPDDRIPPRLSVLPGGPVPQQSVFDLADRSPTPAPTSTGPRATTPASPQGSPRRADGTARVDRPLVAGPAGPPSTSTRPSALSLEAEGDSVTRSGQAAPRAVAAASGGVVIGWVGNGSGNTLRFTGLDVPAAGPYDLVVAYCSGEVRSADIAVNGSPVARVDFASTGSFDTVATTTVRLPLAAGPNTVEFSNPDAWAPDFDRVTLTR